MSLKAIELQVALPRTQSVGKIQDQLQQRGQVVQDHLGIEQQKEDEKKRKQVLETTEAEKKRLNNDDERKGHHQREQENQKSKQSTVKKEDKLYAKHPYKGNYIDFSG